MPCVSLPHMEEEEEDSLIPEHHLEDAAEDCRTPDRLDSTDGAMHFFLTHLNLVLITCVLFSKNTSLG